MNTDQKKLLRMKLKTIISNKRTSPPQKVEECMEIVFQLSDNFQLTDSRIRKYNEIDSLYGEITNREIKGFEQSILRSALRIVVSSSVSPPRFF